MTTVAAAVGGVLAACDGAASTPGVALFDVPRLGTPSAEFYALPFPNDIRRGDDGHPILDDYPRPSSLVAPFVDACETLDGFGTNSGVFLRFSSSLVDAALPDDAAGSLADDASVYLVDVQVGSPSRGQRHPIRLQFQEQAGWTIGDYWLAALPYPGFPLRPSTTYALVVTRRINTDAVELSASADLSTILGSATPAEPELGRAQQRYRPLLDWLDEPGGDERADVVSAAVFTTQSVTELMGALRAAVRALPAPVPRELVEIPTGTSFRWYDGMFDAPNFQTGAPPYRTPTDGGDIVRGDDGVPQVQRMEALRFAITTPTGTEPLTGWPVAIYAHGTGGDVHSFIYDGTAGRLAAEGIAVISIDQVLHGPRNPGGNPSLDFFNFQNPLSARNNAVQGAADNFSVVRLVEAFAPPASPEPDPPQAMVHLDPAKIFFFGHSQGGITGPPFVAYEPQIRGAVLSGAGGWLVAALLEKTEPVDISTLVRAAVADDPLDEFNPVLSLLQTWIERSDPVNYGPLLVREPPDGVSPRPVYQSMGFVDHYTPDSSIAALAVAIGGDLVAPIIEPIEGLQLRGRMPVPAPATGNLDGTTAVVAQYPAFSDGHFVVFDVPSARRQSARFLGTLVETGAATLVP